MKLKVVSYNISLGEHGCVLENDKRISVDIMVDGKLKYTPQFYVGKEIECEYLFPCTFIAMGVTEPAPEQGSEGESL